MGITLEELKQRKDQDAQRIADLLNQIEGILEQFENDTSMLVNGYTPERGYEMGHRHPRVWWVNLNISI